MSLGNATDEPGEETRVAVDGDWQKNVEGWEAGVASEGELSGTDSRAVDGRVGLREPRLERLRSEPWAMGGWRS